MRYGVSVSSIGNVISAMIGGIKSGQFTEDGHRYYVNLRVEPSERQKVEDIKDLFVRNNKSELVRVADVIKIEENTALQSITRINRERAITIFANPSPGTSQDIALKMQKTLRDPYYQLVTQLHLADQPKQWETHSTVYGMLYF